MVQNNLEEYKKANADFAVCLFDVSTAVIIKCYPQKHSPNDPRPRGTLLITDRSMDMLTPFIHEFTYQAMANDLLPIENGTKYTFVIVHFAEHHAYFLCRYKFQSSVGAYEDKTATLSDSDTVWTSVRHMHMKDAIDKLMSDFNKFLEENAVFKKGSVTLVFIQRHCIQSVAYREGAASLNDMKDMLANLPQYQEQREKVHISRIYCVIIKL